MADRLLEVQRFQPPFGRPTLYFLITDDKLADCDADGGPGGRGGIPQTPVCAPHVSLVIQLLSFPVYDLGPLVSVGTIQTSGKCPLIFLPRMLNSNQGNHSASEQRQPSSLALLVLVASSVYDSVTRRRFLMDTGAQISVVIRTPAKYRCPRCGLHLQAANCSPLPAFDSMFFTLDIGLSRSFPWIFVIGDIHHAILGSDLIAEFDLLADCRRSRLLDHTTGPSIRELNPFTTFSNLSVMDIAIACPHREHLLQHPNITNP
nr:unnamed protein product [Spirometra erinaceieuropaei]